MQRKIMALALAACFVQAPAYAQSAADLAGIRQQLDAMKRNYESRIEALEKRLAEAEARAGSAQQQAAQAGREAQAALKEARQAEARQAATQVAQGTGGAAGRPQSASAFNPEMSLILQGRAARLSQDPATYTIGGFLPTGGEIDPGKRGLSLAESEIVLSANVDPNVSASFVAALAPEGGVDVENAYLQTLGLGHGLTLKGGRFFSRIGYQNEQHSHAWDFVDAPLAYRAFFGGQLADDGLQLRWVAPTDLLVELGAEIGRGLNFPANDRNKNGSGLGALFARVGGDLGASHSWRTGLSYVRTRADHRSWDDVDSTGAAVTNAFTGRSRTWVADFVWKWAPEGNATGRNFKFQTEYFRRSEDGTVAFDTATPPATLTPGLTGDYASRQSGWYAQAVYQFMPRWRAGVRADRLSSGNVSIGQVASGALTAADFPTLASHRPGAGSAMLDWSPSEFSRFRLQFTRDRSRPGVTDNQLFLQYVMSLGAHGAHSW
jgi:hypothetical protein